MKQLKPNQRLGRHETFTHFTETAFHKLVMINLQNDTKPTMKLKQTRILDSDAKVLA